MHQITSRWRVLTTGFAGVLFFVACNGSTPTPVVITAPPVVQPTPQTVVITAPPVVQPTPQTVVITAPPVVQPTPQIITPVPIVTSPPIPAGPGPNGGTVVRWFIGLGAGTQPAQIGPEQAFITAYNASQKDVYLQYEIVDNTQAANILKTEIAAGNAPDTVSYTH